MLSEIVIVPTYNRPEMLFYCLTLIRAFEPDIPIAIFPDRGTFYDKEFCEAIVPFAHHRCGPVFVPEHDYHGNTYNTMEALRWAFNLQRDRIYYIEDDVMVHPDFFKWHREVHEDNPDIFASMAWVFNRYAPINQDLLFQPWYYSIGTCFTLKKLELIAQHASPLYYGDMQGYIEKRFKNSKLNSPLSIQHFEQDGLIQRVLDVDRSQTVTCGIAKCTHIGTFGYNRGWTTRDDIFDGCETFDARVGRLSEFVGDPYQRIQYFDREVVEREIGRVLPKREFKYKIILPGGWESNFTSELTQPKLPKRINSVHLPAEARIVVES